MGIRSEAYLMARERILIAVKTYPTLSEKYRELACTAGFREDGSWIRLYPVPFRFLEDNQRYKKYQWVELDVTKNTSDPRPESFRPKDLDNITLSDVIGTDKGWEVRRNLILAKNTVYTKLDELIALANSNKLSIAIFKPKEVIEFIAEASEPEWAPAKLNAVLDSLKQGDLFEERDLGEFKIMPKLPYKFSYRFLDENGTSSTLMIEDWEIGQLYWNCVKNYGEANALEKVKQKYFDDFAKTKDLHLFLGTTRQYHGWAKNPFVIIGTFHPPHVMQNSFLL